MDEIEKTANNCFKKLALKQKKQLEKAKIKYKPIACAWCGQPGKLEINPGAFFPFYVDCGIYCCNRSYNIYTKTPGRAVREWNRMNKEREKEEEERA